MTPDNDPNKALPAGVLVFYDEGKGLRQPTTKLFNPSPGIEQDVNEWIKSRPGVVVHRIDWIPSGGLMGASVLYSTGNRATEALRVPRPSGASTGPVSPDFGLQRLGVLLILVGVLVGLASLVMFTVFYPATWYGEAGALLDRDLAVKSTILAAGLGLLLIFLGVDLVFRGRIGQV